MPLVRTVERRAATSGGTRLITPVGTIAVIVINSGGRNGMGAIKAGEVSGRGGFVLLED